MIKDLTVGKPDTVLWKFCMPLFGSIIFQQLYNIADSWVAGKFIGENALAAVGNSYEITMIFIAVAFGCNIGCSVITAQLFGAKRYKRMKTAISTALISTLTLCVALMFVGILFCGSLLRIINTPERVFADSKLYLDIYVWSLPFVFMYNLSSGIFTALGDSKTPFVFLAASSTVNIAMDILFVCAFRMGVAGVAWATFICQGVSCVLALAVVFKRLCAIETQGRAPLFSGTLLKQFAAIAIPSALQQSFVSVGNIIIRGVINGFGLGVMAGYSAAIKLNTLIVSSFTTIGNGISNYTAQNIGAGKNERIKAGFYAGIKLVWLICVPVIAVYILFAGSLVGFFMDSPSEEAIATGVAFLRIVAPFYFVVSLKLIADGILRGAEYMYKFMIATFADLFIRVVLAIILAEKFGSIGIWCSWPIGWTIAAVMSFIFYRSGPWAEKCVDVKIAQ